MSYQAIQEVTAATIVDKNFAEKLVGGDPVTRLEILSRFTLTEDETRMFLSAPRTSLNELYTYVDQQTARLYPQKADIYTPPLRKPR